MHVWRSRLREESPISHAALGGNPSGDISLIIPDTLDGTLVSLAAQTANGGKRKLHLVHVIVVPRSLPVTSVMTRELERAERLLGSALQITEQIGCESVAEIVQARSAGQAIVDEAKDHNCSLLMLSLVCHPGHRSLPDYLGETVPYVLANAHCRVWVVHDPPEQPPIGEEKSSTRRRR